MTFDLEEMKMTTMGVAIDNYMQKDYEENSAISNSSSTFLTIDQ